MAAVRPPLARTVKDHRKSALVGTSRERGSHMSHEIIVVVGLIVLATLVLMGMLARLFRKAGPNEALIVYGMRGQPMPNPS